MLLCIPQLEDQIPVFKQTAWVKSCTRKHWRNSVILRLTQDFTR